MHTTDSYQANCESRRSGGDKPRRYIFEKSFSQFPLETQCLAGKLRALNTGPDLIGSVGMVVLLDILFPFYC